MFIDMVLKKHEKTEIEKETCKIIQNALSRPDPHMPDERDKPSYQWQWSLQYKFIITIITF